MNPVPAGMAVQAIEQKRSSIDAVLPEDYPFESLQEKLTEGLSTLFTDQTGESLMILEVVDKETILVDLVYSTKPMMLDSYRDILGKLARCVGALYVVFQPHTPAHERLYRMKGCSPVDASGYSMITVAQLIGDIH